MNRQALSVAAVITAVTVAAAPLSGAVAGARTAETQPSRTAVTTPSSTGVSTERIVVLVGGETAAPVAEARRAAAPASATIPTPVGIALRDARIDPSTVRSVRPMGRGVYEIFRELIVGRPGAKAPDGSVLPKTSAPGLARVLFTGEYGTAALMVGAAGDALRLRDQPSLLFEPSGVPLARDDFATRGGQFVVSALNSIGLPWQVITAAADAITTVLTTIPQIIIKPAPGQGRWNTFTTLVENHYRGFTERVDVAFDRSYRALGDALVNGNDPKWAASAAAVHDPSQQSSVLGRLGYFGVPNAVAVGVPAPLTREFATPPATPDVAAATVSELDDAPAAPKPTPATMGSAASDSDAANATASNSAAAGGAPASSSDDPTSSGSED